MIVDFYEQVGYLPDAILNYLVLLGWSLDDKTEFFTRDEMIENSRWSASAKRRRASIRRSSGRFRITTCSSCPRSRRCRSCCRICNRPACSDQAASCDVGPVLPQIVEAAGDRIKISGDILDYADFFTARRQARVRRSGLRQADSQRPGRGRAADAVPHAVGDGRAVRSRRRSKRSRTNSSPPRASRTANSSTRCASRSTGKGVGFGLFDTLAILGRERSPARESNSQSRVRAQSRIRTTETREAREKHTRADRVLD